MKFFLRETESWSAVNKSKLHKTEKVSVIIEPSDNRYNSDLVCMVLGKFFFFQFGGTCSSFDELVFNHIITTSDPPM